MGETDDRAAVPGADADLADHLAAWTPPWARPAAPGRGDEADGGGRAGPGTGPWDDDATGAPRPVGDPAGPGPGVPVPADADTGNERAPDAAVPDTEPPGDEPGPDAPDADTPATAPPVGGPDGPEPPGAAAAEPDGGAGDGQPALPELDDPQRLRGAVEAILMVVDEPVSEEMLAQVLRWPTDLVLDALRRLADSYTAQGRGFDLRRAAGGWRMYSRDEFAGYVERFVLDGQQVRLTQAALETLAVVAYKQPVTRGRISAIRGVNCDGVVRTLLTRGLIEECGSEPESGAHLYRTTTLFLERMGIDSADELPDLAPLLPDDLPEEV